MKLGWMQGSGEDIVAFRGERGSYNLSTCGLLPGYIVAFRGERGSYNVVRAQAAVALIVAFRGERGSYNWCVA